VKLLQTPRFEENQRYWGPRF